MKLRLFVSLSVLALGALLSACGGKPAQPAATEEKPATPDQLVELWDQLIAKPTDEVDFELALAVATDMSNRGEEGIKPILDRLDVPEPTPQVIVLTSAALRSIVNESHQDALIELTRDTHSSRTRRVAIDLLGGIETDKAIARINELEQDEDLLMVVAAFLARLHLGDADYVARMGKYWEDPKVHDLSRQEMLRRLPEAHANVALDILCEAVNRADWDREVVRRCIGTLGFQTDQKAYDALVNASQSLPDQELSEFAKLAAAAMKTRMDAGQKVEHFEVGPGGVSGVTTTLSAEPTPAPAAE